MNKNERFLASQLNDIKAKLNAELKRRAGEGSVFGLADEVYKAHINEMPRIQEWMKTIGIDLATIDVASGNLGATIEPNKHYLKAAEYNQLVNKINQ